MRYFDAISCLQCPSGQMFMYEALYLLAHTGQGSESVFVTIAPPSIPSAAQVGALVVNIPGVAVNEDMDSLAELAGILTVRQ